MPAAPSQPQPVRRQLASKDTNEEDASQEGLYAGANEAEVAVVLECLDRVKAAKEGNGKKFIMMDHCIAASTSHTRSPGCDFFQDKVEGLFERAVQGETAAPEEDAEVPQSRRSAAAGGASEAGRKRSYQPRYVVSSKGTLTTDTAPPSKLSEEGGSLSNNTVVAAARVAASVSQQRLEGDEDVASPVSAIGADPRIMQHNRHLFRSGDAQAVAAVSALRALADTAADTEDATVIKKTIMPPTGDKRTYYSLDTYCWPANNSTTNPEGPWAMRDGFPFPGRHDIAPDAQMLVEIIERVNLLGMAFYFTGEERYAARAADKLRTFFLDETTGMLPSLEYAAMHPGVSVIGKFTGLINFRNMETLLDGVSLLKGAVSWSDTDDHGLRRWMGEYVGYLQSAHVKAERCSSCNHGAYYDLQLISILRYLGRHEAVRAYIEKNVKGRLRVMLNGSMFANEMIRPTSYFYQNFILEGVARLASQAKMEGIDLWRYRAEGKNSILDAWDWMSPHWCNRGDSWPLAQPEGSRMEMGKALEWMGLVYSEVTSEGEYTLRSHEYAHTFASLKDTVFNGEDTTIAGRSLMRVRVDDCFLQFCPERSVRQQDPPMLPTQCTIPQAAASDRPVSQFSHSPQPCIGAECKASLAGTYAIFLLVATAVCAAFMFVRRRRAVGGGLPRASSALLFPSSIASESTTDTSCSSSDEAYTPPGNIATAASMSSFSAVLLRNCTSMPATSVCSLDPVTLTSPP